MALARSSYGPGEGFVQSSSGRRTDFGTDGSVVDSYVPTNSYYDPGFYSGARTEEEIAASDAIGDFYG